jgi:colanic acid/amylovoran biosynthesis glycosyltransferase
MYVAHIVGKFPSISQTFILNQISGIIQGGKDIHVFAREKPDRIPEHRIINEYNLTENVTYVKVENYTEGVKILVNTVPYLLTHGFGFGDVLPVLRYGKEAPRRLSYVRSLHEHDKEFDVYHGHFGTVTRQFLNAKKELGGPLMVSFYGADVSRAPISNPSIYDELFDDMTIATCLSEDMRTDLVDLGCPANKTRKVPLCVDTKKFQYKERDLNPGEPIKILTVARFVEKKGLEYAIKAVSELDTEREIQYSIAGDGKKREELKNLMKNLGVEDRIKLLGWQTQEQISDLMDESHLFLLPSVTASSGDKEGTPTVLLEAQATGLPIVSTYHAGIPEIVDDGNAGILVPERDVESLTDALEELAQHPERWSSMGRSGREYIGEEHSIDSVSERLLDIYESIS